MCVRARSLQTSMRAPYSAVPQRDQPRRRPSASDVFVGVGGHALRASCDTVVTTAPRFVVVGFGVWFSKVDITNWFTNDEYLAVEYEHAALIAGVRVKIEAYCLVFHIRDERFDSMREYINPSNPATSILLSLVLRAYPFLARWRARSAAAS